MIYLFVLFLLIFLSFHYDVNGKTKYRDQWYLIMLIIFILVAGLRYRLGTDTIGALDSFFTFTPTIDNLSFDYLSIKYPLWKFMNSFVYTVFGKFFVLQLIQATIVNVLFFRYIRKHSLYIFTCLLFFFILMYTSLIMEEMKSSLSVAVCLYANDYILEKKWIKGLCIYFIGCLFHFSTWLLIFFIPFICFLKMNRWGGVILLFAFVSGYIIQKMMGDYLMILEFSEDVSEKAELYAESEKYGEMQGLGYIVKRVLISLFYTISCYIYVGRYHAKEKTLRMEPFLVLGLIFLLVQVNIPIFYRYYRFYEIYSIIIYSYVAIHLIKDTQGLSIGVSSLRSFAFFFPLIFIVLWGYKGKYYRYYPYYSVIERKIDKQREMKQREYHPNRRYPKPYNY